MSVTVRELLRVIGFAIMAVVVLHEALHGVKHLKCPPDHCHCPLPHKFLAGLPLHGKTVTDATWFRPANKDLTQAKKVGPFLKMPGWKRRLIRTGPVLAAAGLLVDQVVAGAVLAGLVVVVVAWRASWVRRKLRAVFARLAGWLCAAWDRRMPDRLRAERARLLWDRLPLWLRTPRHRDRVQTMGMLLASITGTAASSVESGVTWNPDYTTAEPGEEVARWVLPRGFKATSGEKSMAAEVWQSRIGFGMTFAWKLDVDEPVLVMRRAFELPSIVFLHDVLEKVRALPEEKVAIGLDDRGNLVCWSWKTENPHGLLNAGSRHGKTETEMAMVAQVLQKGGLVTYVDVKRVSIQGLTGLPGLTLADDPRDMVGMWLTIDKWGKELDQRIDDRKKDPTCEFTRNLLVLEEVNQFSEMCDEFWENWPEEDEEWQNTILWKPKRAKKTPPIWRVIRKGVWEGAFAKMNVLIAGQNIEAQTVKGVRNSIGMRLMGGYQPQNWKALVGTTPIPPAPPTKGRWCMINGSSQTWVQALIADLDANQSAAIWRDYARAGRRMDGSVRATEGTGAFAVTGSGVATRVTDNSGANMQASAVSDHTQQPVTDPRGVLVSITEAVERGHAPGATREALHMDRYRSDKDQLPRGLKFPEVAQRDGQKELFWSGDIEEFNAKRRGVRAS